MTEQGKYVCVGLGEILWDMLPAGKQLGGAPANFAYHAQALGAQGVVVSCIGNDALGREIITRLDELHLDRSYLAVDKAHPTGTVTVELDENGKPDYTIHENVAWDFIPSDPRLADLAARTDAVCFGSLCQRSRVSHLAVRAFLKATRPQCIRVFDINLRQSYFNKGIVQTMLELSNVLKLNDEELPVVAEMLGLTGNLSDVLLQLTQKYALRMIALTRGANGSCLYTPKQMCSHRGFATQIADTVGAGDSFAAAVALGLLYGRTLDEINEFANRLASFVCSQSGATPRLPDTLAKEFGPS
ncbi:MAG TPA: carbohydrate kinase [Sedimentisphaerales bacterium]|nr:carbohydrate kinase [Sedimentisphaerales bacterium]